MFNLKKKSFKNPLILFIFLVFIFSIFSLHVLAAPTDSLNEVEREPFEYKLMVPLPTASETVATTTGIVDYIKTLYLFGMGIAGVLAMAMIIVGGFQWMGGGSITSTRAAKSRISNAILGLVLLLAAYLILNTINPALVNLKEPHIYFAEWYKDFPDDGSTGTGGGGGPGPGPGQQWDPGDCQAIENQYAPNNVPDDCAVYGYGPSVGQALACEADYCNFVSDRCEYDINASPKCYAS